MKPAVISVEQAAQVLRIGRGLAYRLARNGEMPVLRVGRVLRVPLDELRVWIATRVASNRASVRKHQRRRKR